MFRSSSARLIYEYRFGQPSLKKAFTTKIRAEPIPAVPGKLQKTTLANGVRVVSHDLDGPQTTVAVYADAGPKYDPSATPGLSFVMRYALQTSNMDSSLFQIDRTMRATGNAYGHSEIGKRFLAWRAEGRRDMWEKPFEMLATGIVAPRFHESDIERFRDTMDNQLDELRWLQPRQFAVDQLETVAFYKEPLGNPRMVPHIANDRCSHQALLDHWAAMFVPKNITIAAVNVPHEALVAAYEKLPYKHSAEAPHHARSTAPKISNANEAAQFYPGRHLVEFENRPSAMGTKPDMEPEVVAAVGVPTFGRDHNAKQFATALIAKELYAASVQKLYPNGHSQHDGVSAFYRPYASAGLIGYTIRGSPKQIEALLKDAAGAFPTAVEAAGLEAARARAATTFVCDELEMSRDYCDFIATSTASSEEVSAAIKAVSKADVEALFKQVLAVKPATYATGNVFTFPAVARLNAL